MRVRSSSLEIVLFSRDVSTTHSRQNSTRNSPNRYIYRRHAREAWTALRARREAYGKRSRSQSRRIVSGLGDGLASNATPDDSDRDDDDAKSAAPRRPSAAASGGGGGGGGDHGWCGEPTPHDDAAADAVAADDDDDDNEPRRRPVAAAVRVEAATSLSSSSSSSRSPSDDSLLAQLRSEAKRVVPRTRTAAERDALDDLYCPISVTDALAPLLSRMTGEVEHDVALLRYDSRPPPTTAEPPSEIV